MTKFPKTSLKTKKWTLKNGFVNTKIAGYNDANSPLIIMLNVDFWPKI